MINTEERLMAELDDDYILFIFRLPAARCEHLARRHAKELQQRALVALTAGRVDEALWYQEREFEFNCRAFGIRDTCSRASAEALKAIKQYIEICESAAA
jgi:hypothetical protein